MGWRRWWLRVGVGLLVGVGGVALVGMVVGRRVAEKGVVPEVVRDALEHADSFEVFSIEPDMAAGGLDRYHELGRVKVTDRRTQKKLSDALEWAAVRNYGWTALCFEPRHGIRVSHGGVTTDFVICFHCVQVEVWQGGHEVAMLSTDKSLQPMFDDLLTDAGVPLAAKDP